MIGNNPHYRRRENWLLESEGICPVLQLGMVRVKSQTSSLSLANLLLPSQIALRIAPCYLGAIMESGGIWRNQDVV